MAVNKMADFEARLSAMEESTAKLAEEFRMFCLTTGEKHQTLTDAFDAFKVDLTEQLDTIIVFVSGASTIYGLAKRHWKRIFIFGAGVMTSAGFGNPKVWAFISSFAGG